MEHDKEYLATLRFGVRTDTHDAGGRVLSTAPPPPLTREALQQATRPLVGRIRQVPPMYSALRHRGRRLWELARAGVEVERAPREVVVFEIEVVEVAEPLATLRVVCGKGTYVRVLAADLGEALGCGAVVERLTRVRVGPFRREAALSWAEATGASREGLWARVAPCETALAAWPAVSLGERAMAAFLHGQVAEVAGAPPATAGQVRVHDGRGAFLGVGALSEGGRRVHPVRILHADRPGTRVLPA
jgi:tRNA pseudouridine55 synthase